MLVRQRFAGVDLVEVALARGRTVSGASSAIAAAAGPGRGELLAPGGRAAGVDLVEVAWAAERRPAVRGPRARRTAAATRFPSQLTCSIRARGGKAT
jgi:hypothetical protein